MYETVVINMTVKFYVTGYVRDRHLALHLHDCSTDQKLPARWRQRRHHLLPETGL